MNPLEATTSTNGVGLGVIRDHRGGDPLGRLAEIPVVLCDRDHEPTDGGHEVHHQLEGRRDFAVNLGDR